MKRKACSTCKKILAYSMFYPHKRMKLGLQSNCKTCARAWHKARPEYVREKNKKWKKKHPNYMKDWTRKANYGLFPSQVQEIRERQNLKCAGCLNLLSECKECVDHCHKSGRVRGLLCDLCNVGIGRLKDDPTILRRLADYLEEAEEYSG